MSLDNKSRSLRGLANLRPMAGRTTQEEPGKARERKRRAECDDPRVAVGPGFRRSARRDGRRMNVDRRRPWPSPNFLHPKSDGFHFEFREKWRRSGFSKSYKVYLRVAILEIEKAHRSVEYTHMLQRGQILNQRFREIDDEKRQLFDVMSTRDATLKELRPAHQK